MEWYCIHHQLVKINLDQGIHQSKSQLAALWERIDFDQAIHQRKTQLAAILQEITNHNLKPYTRVLIWKSSCMDQSWAHNYRQYARVARMATKLYFI